MQAGASQSLALANMISVCRYPFLYIHTYVTLCKKFQALKLATKSVIKILQKYHFIRYFQTQRYIQTYIHPYAISVTFANNLHTFYCFPAHFFVTSPFTIITRQQQQPTLFHILFIIIFFFLCTFEIAVTCLFIHAKCYPARWLLKIKNMYLSQRRGTKCRLKNAPEFIDDCVCKYFGFFSSFVLDRSGEIPLEFAMCTKLLMERLKFNLIFVFYFLECLVFVFIQYYLENLWIVVTFGFSKFFTDIIFLLIN